MTQEPRFSVEKPETTESQTTEQKSTSLEEKKPNPLPGRFIRALGELKAKFSEGDAMEYLPSRTPEENLLIAIVSRAVVDAVTAPKLYPNHKQKSLSDEAKEYIKGISNDPFSFRWVLTHLVEDVDSAQRNAIKFIDDPELRSVQLLDYFGQSSGRYLRTRRRMTKEAP